MSIGVVASVLLLAGQSLWAQSSSMLRPKPGADGKPLTVSQTSWLTVELPKPRRIAKHDILTVLIEERTMVSMQDSFDRESSKTTKAKLEDWEWTVRGFEAIGDLHLAMGKGRLEGL